MKRFFILTAGFGVLAFAGFWWVLGKSSDPRPITPRAALPAVESQRVRIFSDAAASVVSITTIEVQRDRWSFDVSAIPNGAGSGFIWDDSGHIVTNLHVIAGADGAQVTLYDQEVYEADLVGFAPELDLAVLKIDAPASVLRPIPIGASSELRVGQTLLAIGNPFGLDHSLTVGVVSALGRTIQSMTGREIEGVIQTDASINPGNSGGPLLDSAGRLVGINTAIRSPSGGSAGVGFAVSAASVNRAVPQLIQHGRLIKPHLGIRIAPDGLARRIGAQGVVILAVEPGGPAERAGLKGAVRGRRGGFSQGDVILALNDQRTQSGEELSRRLEEHDVGTTIKLSIRRTGKTIQVPVALTAKKEIRP